MPEIPRFCLEPLTLPGLPALDMVRVAAGAGYEFVSLTLNAPLSFVPADAIVRDGAARAAVARAMRDTGVGLFDIECFNLTPDARIEDFRAALECGHALGARSGLAILWDNPDRADALGKFRSLCDMAAGYGIRINLEFLKSTHDMDSLPRALAFIEDAGCDNAGLVLDMVHVARTGTSIADLAALDPRRVGWVQLCDGPAEMPPELILREAGEERLYPGDGALPVRPFAEALPQAVVGIEVPAVSALRSLSPLDHARKAIAAARAIYAPG